MTTLNGIDHLALATSDMRSAVEFYTDVLGLSLGGLFWMHGVDGAVHAFLPFPDGRTLSLIQFTDDPPRQVGVSHPISMRHAVPGGVMQHVAFQVDDDVALEAMRERLEAKGVTVTKPVDHGFCRSVYFRGPDHTHLEATCVLRPMDDREFELDAAEHCGITADDLHRFRSAAATGSNDG